MEPRFASLAADTETGDDPQGQPCYKGLSSKSCYSTSTTIHSKKHHANKTKQIVVKGQTSVAVFIHCRGKTSKPHKRRET